jgi:hypothetical protein
MTTINIFFRTKEETYNKLKNNTINFYNNYKIFLNNTLEYFRNINIIFCDTNNINSISYTSILKNTSNDNINIVKLVDNNNYFINSFYFNISKWIFFIISNFININIIFVDIIPLNIIDIFKFYKNSNVRFEIVTNNQLCKNIISEFINKNYNIIINKNFDSNLNIIDNLMEKNKDILYHEQIKFFNYISKIDNNSNLTCEQLNFINGLNYFIKFNNNYLYILWEISYEGQIAIDLFIKDGKK